MKNSNTSAGNEGLVKNNKFPRKIRFYIFFAALTALIFTGCASLFYSVNIRTSGGVSSVLAGGSIQFSTGGRNIVWQVGTRSDGTGNVANGTFISSSGLLSVDIYETASILYVMAMSTRDGFSDVRQIRVVTVADVNISSVSQIAVAGRTLQFGAQVTGTNNPDQIVTWKVSSSGTGTGTVTQGTSINSNGVLTVAANETLSTLFITATSTVDPSKSKTVSVSVVVPTVTNVAVSPVGESVRAGTTFQFRATVTGTYEPSQSVTWRVSSNAAGTGVVTPGTSISSAGLLTVAAGETLSTLYVIATSSLDTSKMGSTIVNIIIPTVTSVTVGPANQTIPAGSSFQFTATVAGANNPDTSVTWKVSTTAAGTGVAAQGTSITNGQLTVAANETAVTLFVFATSVFDPSKTGSVIVTVTPAPVVTQPVPVVQTVTGVSVSPVNITMQTGSSFQFNAAVSGANNPSTSVTWRVSSNAAGTGAVTAGTSINASGQLTIAANESARTLYVIATSEFDPARSGNVAVNVSAPAVPAVTSVTVDPANQTVQAGGSLQLNAIVTGSNNPSTAVTWIISSNTAGTGSVTAGTSISANGLLTISSNEPARTLYVIAVSAADPSKTGNVSVNITVPVVTQSPPPVTSTVTSISISPSSQNMTRGSSYQFSAIVRGDNNPSDAVTWKVSSNTAGTGAVTSGTTISSSGLLTVSANETNAMLYVIATSAVDTSKSGSSPVTVINALTVSSVTVTPSAVSVMANNSSNTVQFNAAVAGLSSNAVTWSVSSNSAGTGSVESRTVINSNGLLTVAPNEGARFLYVFARSTADPSIYSMVIVTITNN